MPIPWAMAAKVIPWGEVIAAAPKVVKSARELWKRSGEPADEAAENPIERLEVRIDELENHLETSSGLIAQLAEHNEGLVLAIDRLQRRLTIATVLAALALLAALAAWLTR